MLCYVGIYCIGLVTLYLLYFCIYRITQGRVIRSKSKHLNIICSRKCVRHVQPLLLYSEIKPGVITLLFCNEKKDNKSSKETIN